MTTYELSDGYSLAQIDPAIQTDWSLYLNSSLRSLEVARFYLNSDGELTQIVLLPDASYHERQYALRTALAHWCAYVPQELMTWQRPSSGSYVTFAGNRYARNLETSLQVLKNLSISDELRGKSNLDLEGDLAVRHATVIHASFNMLEQALQMVVDSPVFAGIALSYCVLPTALDGAPSTARQVTFTSDKPFVIWPNLNGAKSQVARFGELQQHPRLLGHSLQIMRVEVRRMRGLSIKSEGRILNGHAVRAVEPPHGTRGDTLYWRRPWADVKNPFYAKGNKITMTISGVAALQNDGVVEVLEALASMLEIGGLYADVDDAFFAPQEYWQRAEELQSDNRYVLPGTPREAAHLLWFYRTVRDERLFAEVAYPGIFYLGDWLDVLAKLYPAT